MPYTRQHLFDEAVIDNINSYIEEQNLSHSKIAKASGLSYQQLYQIRHKHQRLKLTEYVKLCKAFDEPLDKFIAGIDTRQTDV